MKRPTVENLARTFVLMTIVAPLHGQGLGAVRGTVKDASSGVIVAAKVTLKETHTDWTQTTQSDSTGAFVINGIPLGEYTLRVEHEGFAPSTQPVQVLIGSAPSIDVRLEIGAAASSVTVNETASEVLAAEASAAPTLVSGDQIREGLPGAEQMSSLRFVTETAPGAFVLHDHLHVRGGHQIDWILNGVPIPNTNMSSNVGRTLDPKDIEEVEVSQGGFGAQSGDRTFAQINIFTRSGFEFHNDGDLTMTYGSFHQTNDQLNFGAHSSKFAYYVSATGNRTDLGLEPPVREIENALGSGQGLFTSMNYRLSEVNQLAWTASSRRDRFQIPVDPSDTDRASDTYFGIRDIDQERDTFATFSWAHTLNPGTLLTVSPFYRNNDAQYIGSKYDPLVANSRNTSNYSGGQVELKYVYGRHNLTAGVYAFYQRNNLLFSLRDNTETPSQFASVDAIPSGGLIAEYVNDQFKPAKWLTLNGGVRATHFAGVASESAVNPRTGATIEIPKIHWVLRGFYGTYYQAPPLYTVGGAVFQLAAATGDFGFTPLRGERDVQREFGLTIPLRGWVLDATRFQTSSRNFLDHDVLGASNILLPLTTPNARIWGFQTSLRSPLIGGRLRLHAAFADMTAQYRGQPLGGLLESAGAPDDGTDCTKTYCYLDHDQRVNLTAGFQVSMPWQMNLAGNVVYGSGVLLADGPRHLPSHTTGDLYLSKSFAERWQFGVTALNISNSRFPFDISSSFAGSHFNNPREIYASARYRFHF